MSSRSVFGAVIVLLALTVGRASADDTGAPAERRRIVGILDVRGPGADVTTGFETSLEQQIDTKQYWLVPRARLRERLVNSTKWTEGCLSGPCLAEVRVQTNADFVLLAALTGSGTSFGFVVTLLRTDTGAVVSQEGERCDVCTLDEAMNAAILATLRLLVALPDHLPSASADAEAAAALAAATASTQRLEARSQRRERQLRRRGLLLTSVGLAAVVAGLAIYFAVDSEPPAALVVAGAGGGLAASGLTLFVF